MTQKENTAPSALDLAAYRWTEAKARERAANEERIAIEAEILTLVGYQEEGVTKGESDFYKVTTTGKLTRSLMKDYGQRLEGLAPEILNAIVRYKPELDVSAFKKLAVANPEAYRLACTAIETKPAKPSVAVELKAA